MASYFPGYTVYFVILNNDGKVWNQSSFVDYSVAIGQWNNCVFPMTDSGGGNYVGTFPTTIGAGIYYMDGYTQLGGSPSPSDSKIVIGAIEWDGSTESGSGGGTAREFSVSVGDQSAGVRVGTVGIKTQAIPDTSFVRGVRS